MAEAQVYNRVLTAVELAGVMAGGSPATANRVLYYKCNEGTGTTVNDLAGTNTATILNPTGHNWVQPGPFPASQSVTLTVTDNSGNNNT